uniref:Odorant receptor n=1 Tax=Culex pipiens TaxID=7175 RepID=A0A8D8G428_CULPI
MYQGANFGGKRYILFGEPNTHIYFAFSGCSIGLLLVIGTFEVERKTGYFYRFVPMTSSLLVKQFYDRGKSQVKAFKRTLTKDFDHSSDYFFGLNLLMALSGARLNSRNTTVLRWWTIYRWLIPLPMIVIFWNGYLHIKRQAKLDIVLSSVQAMVGFVVIISRVLLILWHYEPLMEVRRYVNRRKFGRDLQSSFNIRSAAFYRIRKIVICMNTTVIMLVATIPMLDNSKHHLYRLPFDVRQSFPSVQYLCEKTVTFFTIGTGMMTMLIYLVDYMILTGLTTEVTVLAQTFAEVFNRTDQQVQRKLESEPSNSQQMVVKTKDYFWDYIQEELGDCIKLHIEFLAIKNKIRPLLNAHFFIVYYLTTLNLASGAIYLSQLKTLTLFSIHTLYYCLLIALECASLTRMVNLLTEANQSIGWELYNLEWPIKLECDEKFQREYRSVRQTMATVMVVSQQPLRFNCFVLFEFTQERFWELLNMAYSLYNFLRNFV